MIAPAEARPSAVPWLVLAGATAAGGLWYLRHQRGANDDHAAQVSTGTDGAAPPPPPGRWLWPVPRWQGRAPVVSDGYGSPRVGGNRGAVHRGADLMFRRRWRGELADRFPTAAPHARMHFMPPGTLALAASDGEIWSARWTPRGFSVVLSHGAPWATYYTHLTAPRVDETRRGAGRVRVVAGQPLGVVGADPKDANAIAHLHFELWHGGNGLAAIDPTPYLARWAVVEPPEVGVMGAALELALAGGVVAGVVWYARRDRDRPGRPAATHDPAPIAPQPSGGAAATTRPPRRGLTRAFDDLFRQHGQGIPVPYLRALGHAESGLHPADRLGLINVVPVAVADYNRRHPGAAVRADQMTDPAVNVRVAADILRTVIASYRSNHPDVPALAEDWHNPAFVELLTFGWNAGYSELAGVGRVVRLLRRERPAMPVTIDAVADAAHVAGAAATLSNPRKRTYSKGVAAAYLREVERDRRDHLPTS